MGLFGGGYSRPGKGVSKEEAAKRNYFDIFFRKIGKIFQVNIIYVLTNILFFGAFAFMIFPIIFTPNENMFNELINNMIKPVLSGKMLIPIIYFIPFVFIGPSTAGLTYVIRNFVRQEHSFVFSDFFEHTKKNLKQGLAASAILTLVTYLYLTAVLFYYNAFSFKIVILAIAAIVGIVLVSASFYVYPIMVTFSMKLKDIFKNSIIFALAKLPQNIFIFAIIFAVHAILIYNYTLIWLLLMTIILIAWTSFTSNYYAWHVIDKLMMSQIEDDDNKVENVFDDELIEK